MAILNDRDGLNHEKCFDRKSVTMQVIYLSHPYDSAQIFSQPLVMALGFFDGVHLGHQTVIDQARIRARQEQIPLAVMTFDQHPKIIYTGISPYSVTYLSTLKRKIELMEDLGVDILYIVRYDHNFGHQKPQEFVDNYIVGLHSRVVVAGFDYTYGPKEIANMDTLIDHSRGRFEIIKVEEQVMHQHKIASSSIKELLSDGQIELANHELGYAYQTSGIVIHGDKRGRKMGYPTANIETSSQELLPGLGIYVVEFYYNQRWYQGMASIGYNISFAGKRDLRCEINIFDFDEDIYGRSVKIRWHRYLRGEIKFNSADELVQQLEQDKIQAMNFFKSCD